MPNEHDEVAPILHQEDRLPTMVLSRAETLLLWQLINNSTAGVPFKFASVAGELYRTVREYAIAHGIRVDVSA